jgi:hypothetical protein
MREMHARENNNTENSLSAFGRLTHVTNGSNRPILLKK